jgi:peptidoglycan/LPS O-acetylase OafA/YrhL
MKGDATTRPGSGGSVDSGRDPTPDVAVAPPGRGRYHVLDGYRAVAALWVLTTHVAFQTAAVTSGTLGALAARLDVGVALFFALSGFVLYGPYARALLTGSPLPSLRRYLRHRAVRILPAYWVLVVLVLGVSADLLRHALMLQTFEPGLLRADLTQTWSLATEVCFYLFLPLYVAVLARVTAGDVRARTRHQLIGLGVLFAVTPLWTWLVLGTGHFDDRVAMLWLPAHMDWFAAGMLLALVRERERVTGVGTGPWRTVASVPGACWAAAAALFVVASTPVSGPLTLGTTTALHAATKETLYLLVAGLVLVAGVWPSSGSVSERLFTVRPVQALGRWSYGLFLWHLVALDLVLRMLHVEAFTGVFWLVLPLTIALGTAFAATSWAIVERPCNRFREPRRQEGAEEAAERG